MSNKKNKTPDIRTKMSQIVSEKLKERTKQGLSDRHQAFAREHQGDSKEQLLEYVRQCAEDLGHSPCSGEVIGGPCIAKRIGGWSQVLTEAGLPPAAAPPLPMEKWRVYKKEFKHQASLHRQEKQLRAGEKQAKRGKNEKT